MGTDELSENLIKCWRGRGVVNCNVHLFTRSSVTYLLHGNCCNIGPYISKMSCVDMLKHVSLLC